MRRDAVPTMEATADRRESGLDAAAVPLSFGECTLFFQLDDDDPAQLSTDQGSAERRATSRNRWLDLVGFTILAERFSCLDIDDLIGWHVDVVARMKIDVDVMMIHHEISFNTVGGQTRPFFGGPLGLKEQKYSIR